MTPLVRPRNRIAAAVILFLLGVILYTVLYQAFPILMYPLIVPVSIFAIIVALSRSSRSITSELVAVKMQVQSAEEMAAGVALELAALRAELARGAETETRAAGFRMQSETAPVAARATTAEAEPEAEECGE